MFPVEVDAKEKLATVRLALKRALRKFSFGPGVCVTETDDAIHISLTGPVSPAVQKQPVFEVRRVFLATITSVTLVSTGIREYGWAEHFVANTASADSLIPTTLVLGAHPTYRNSAEGPAEANYCWDLFEVPPFTTAIGTPVNKAGLGHRVGDVVLMLEIVAGNSLAPFSGQLKYVCVGLNINRLPFLVMVKKVSGVAGDSTTDCTWAYDIFHPGEGVAGTAIATALTPYKPRYPKTTYTAASNDTYGLAMFTGTAYLLLEVYKEYPASSACP